MVQLVDPMECVAVEFVLMKSVSKIELFANARDEWNKYNQINRFLSITFNNI